MRAWSTEKCTASRTQDDVIRHKCDGCHRWLEVDHRVLLDLQWLCPRCVRSWLRAHPKVSVLRDWRWFARPHNGRDR